MGKCLFFDADGTILDIVKGTPEDTKLALQQLRKNGHKTFICTGRSNAFVPEYLMKEIGFDGTLSFETYPCMNSFPDSMADKVLKTIYEIGEYWKTQIIDR